MSQLDLTGYGRVSIEAMVRAAGVSNVVVIEPFKVKKSIEAVKKAIESPGISVVISKEMCTLYAKGLKLQKNVRYRVSGKCANHRDCIDRLGCPAFYLREDRVQIDPALCTGCSVCAQVCPENAILPVKDRQAEGK